jgi:hypothetical protein
MIVIWLAKLIIAWPLTLALFLALTGFAIGAILQVSAIITAVVIVYLLIRTCIDAPAPELAWLRTVAAFVARGLPGIGTPTVTASPTPLPTAEGPCIYACHPHGYLAIAPLVHVLRGDISAALVTTPLAANFPGASVILKTLGIISSDRDSIRAALRAGRSVAVLVGGSREAEATEAGKMTLCADRRGIFEIATETGVPIVPVLSYGENEAFAVWKPAGAWQDWLKRWLHFTVLLPHAADFWKLACNWGPKIDTYIGPAISGPTQEAYREAFEALYEQTRPASYGAAPITWITRPVLPTRPVAASNSQQQK